MASRARLRRLTARLGVVGFALAFLIVAGINTAKLVQGRQAPVQEVLSQEPAEAAVLDTAVSAANPGPATVHDTVTAPKISEHPAAASAPAPSSASSLPASAATPSASHPAPALRIADGRTELGDGVTAVRDGNSVTVHFDTPSMRTRRRDKFERVVRATLPRVFGARADSILARIPAGELVPSGELPAELSGRGLRIPLANGETLALWPRTRPGDGGPFVVAYQATFTR